MLDLFKTLISEQQDEQFGDIADLLGDDHQDEGDEPQASDDKQDQHSMLRNAEQESSKGNPDEQDPDKQGLLRRIQGAHLVYKRKGSDGTYEELWIYNVSRMQQQLETRKKILAGTDIQPKQQQSEDGKQRCKSWTVGNAEMLEITGLPN